MTAPAYVSPGGATISGTLDTELETPAALADGQAAPTVSRVGAVALGTNGGLTYRINASQGGDNIATNNALWVITLNHGYNAAGNYDRLRSRGVGILAIVPSVVADANATASRAVDFGTVTKANVKASAGNVKRLVMVNRNAAVRYGQLHNKATAPAGTDVPVISLPIPAGTANNPGMLSILIDETSYFATGIGWAISTTEATFTDAATASEHTTHLWYA